MDKLIQTIQEEINNLMQSKVAKKNDSQLWQYDKFKTPYDVALKMYDDYINGGLSLKQVGEKYGLSANGVKKAFDSANLKSRTCSEGQLKNYQYDSKIEDVKNGMTLTEFISKYNSDRNTYYRYRKNVGIKEKSFDGEQMDMDIKSGMGVTEFAQKYECGVNTYYRRKRNLKKDLAD